MTCVCNCTATERGWKFFVAFFHSVHCMWFGARQSRKKKKKHAFAPNSLHKRGFLFHMEKVGLSFDFLSKKRVFASNHGDRTWFLDTMTHLCNCIIVKRRKKIRRIFHVMHRVSICYASILSLFFFSRYRRVSNPLDWINPSKPQEKLGKHPCGPKAVALVDSTFDS